METQNYGGRTRVWAYTRVSTDNQTSEEGSLKTQEQRLRAAIEAQGDSVLVRVLREEGISGKSLDRPALQELLAAVRRGDVDQVVVTAIDRLSRSLIDFYELHRVLEECGVRFYSLKEKFDTNSAMGRAMLKIVLVFAELEREQTAERTRTTLYHRAVRGLWNGGHPPLGYESIGDGHIKPVPAEVAVVREAFDQFMEVRSTRKLANWLNDKGYRQKRYISRRRGDKGERPFTQPVVSHMLRNRLYIGEVRNNSQWFPGQHEAVVDDDLFTRVNELLDANAKGAKSPSEVQPLEYLLTGLARCGHCDKALTSSTHRGRNKKRHRYYRCTTTTKKAKTDCPIRLENADKLEAMVLAVVRKSATEPALVAEAVEEAERLFREEIEPAQGRLTQLRGELQRVRGECEALFNMILDRELQGSRTAQERLRALEERQGQLEATIADEEGRLAVAETRHLDAEVVLEALRGFDAAFAALTGSEKKELLQQMLDRVIVYPDRIEIALYDGTEALLRLGEITKSRKGRGKPPPKPVLIEVEGQNDDGPEGVPQARSRGDKRFVYRIEWLPVVGHVPTSERTPDVSA